MLVELDWLDSLYLVEEALTRMDHSKQMLTTKLYQGAQLSSQQEVAVALGHQCYREGHERSYQLAGFCEMELSVQIFMFDAIQEGIQIKVSGESSQFLRLRFQGHVKYVKNANTTSRDSYIAPLIMENKVVTKKVLKEAGFQVPGDAEFLSMEEAVKTYPRFVEQALVIKLRSTNYGLGITIFKEGANLENYQAGLVIAFRGDSSVLVEESMPGAEYRSFVIDGEVQAIMLRVSVNVIGDSVQTVKELVEGKDSGPLRETNYRVPLELIQSSELEQSMLKEQGLTIESVPQTNQIVYLRENSNINTGGDSIDMIDGFSEAYKKIAVSAMEALGAKTSGIDLIIPDKGIDPTTDKRAYGIIETNLDPAMHMYVYSFAGEGRRLTINVLKLLYPKIF